MFKTPRVPVLGPDERRRSPGARPAARALRPKTGGRRSSPLNRRQRRYLRGRADAAVKNFAPCYRRQVAAALLRRLSGELDPQGKPALQLLPSELQGPPDAALHHGLLPRYAADGDSHSRQENYLVLLGGFTLRRFESEEALRKGCEPAGSAALSGYLPPSSPSEYAESLGPLCQGLAGDGPFADPPRELLFSLYHPFRRRFRAGSAGSRRIWRAALGDGIRDRGTNCWRRDSLQAEAFLDAVRFYGQERGRYGAGDLLLRPEPELLGNVLMEDLLPVLRPQALPSIGGWERRRRQLWLRFLREVYSLVLGEISSEFEGWQKEKERLQMELEKKIRPDLDQMLTPKDQIAGKLQGWRRSRGAQRVDETVGLARSSPVAVLQKEVTGRRRRPLSSHPAAGAGAIPEASSSSRCRGSFESWQEATRPRDKEADPYRESLRGLEERFGFRGVTSLLLGARNLLQRLMQNATHASRQLSPQHLGRPAAASSPTGWGKSKSGLVAPTLLQELVSPLLVPVRDRPRGGPDRPRGGPDPVVALTDPVVALTPWWP
ncbi:LOW QUALITY PROTEIN: protein Niban 3 [Morus bassanus]